MTNLIYRGVRHDGQRTTTPRKPQNLIYRGVAHDGLSTTATPVRHRQAEMRYRGIRYTLVAKAVITSGAGTLSTDRLDQTPS